MARRGPQHELLQLLLQGGGHGQDTTSEARLEQLYQEVAPQVRNVETRPDADLRFNHPIVV